MVYCIENGLPMLIENLPVDIDAVLDAVIGKQTIKKGKNLIMKIGDAEVGGAAMHACVCMTALQSQREKA